jgi:hypothetical protein
LTAWPRSCPPGHPWTIRSSLSSGRPDGRPLRQRVTRQNG